MIRKLFVIVSVLMFFILVTPPSAVVWAQEAQPASAISAEENARQAAFAARLREINEQSHRPPLIHWPSTLTLILGEAADAWSTDHNSGVVGCSEANSRMYSSDPSTKKLIMVKAAGAATVVAGSVLLNYFARHTPKHRKFVLGLSRVIGYGGGGLSFAVAARNLRVCH